MKTVFIFLNIYLMISLNAFLQDQTLCDKVKTPPKIDGELNEECWKNLEESAKKQNNVYVGCDDDNIYIAYKFSLENIPSSSGKKRDEADILKDDRFEIILAKTKDKYTLIYYRIAVNAKNVLYDLIQEISLSTGSELSSSLEWNPKANISFRISKSEKTARLEAMIPFSEINMKEGKQDLLVKVFYYKEKKNILSDIQWIKFKFEEKQRDEIKPKEEDGKYDKELIDYISNQIDLNIELNEKMEKGATAEEMLQYFNELAKKNVPAFPGGMRDKMKEMDEERKKEYIQSSLFFGEDRQMYKFQKEAYILRKLYIISKSKDDMEKRLYKDYGDMQREIFDEVKDLTEEKFKEEKDQIIEYFNPDARKLRQQNDSLRQHLWSLRNGIRSYFSAYRVYPEKLEYLVPDYLQSIPKEPVKKSDKIVKDFDGTGGWFYDSITGEVKLNLSGNDSSGKPYKDW